MQPVSTPPPGTIVLPGQQSSGGGAGGFQNDGRNPSVYAVTSNPSGLSFTVTGGATQMTPSNVTPGASTNALAITFTSGYSIPIVQVSDGAHRVFYNSASDSSGSVAVSTLQSIRRAASVSHGLPGARPVFRPFHYTRTGSNIDPSRVAVRYHAAALQASGRHPADVERAVGAHGTDALSATGDPLRVVSVPAGVDVATFTRTLQNQSEVASVDPVHRRHLLSRPATTVSDPGYTPDRQWYTHATGTNFAWSYDTGTGVKLAIIDTGIDEQNTDLTSQLAFQETAVSPIDNVPNAANSQSPTCSPTGPTVVTPNTARDDNGHGTNVAGIALAAANTGGFVGAAFGAKLMSFKIFPDQNASCNDNLATFGATSADEAQAIADAVAQGADVISMSLGGDAFDQLEFNAVENAIAAGVTVVAAAGNSEDASGPGTLDYPAAYPGVISVGASALKDEFYSTPFPQSDGTYGSAKEIVASYSQYGPELSVVAPGGDVMSVCNPVDTTQCDIDLLHWISNYSTSTAFLPADQCSGAPPTGCTALFAGTSMATPQVAATAAMLLAEAGGHHSLTPAQINYAIESTADNINDPRQGHGRLNAYRALASLIRDTSAYSGPGVQAAGTAQLVAFAYNAHQTNKPVYLDANFPAGVPVNADGTFRIADVPVATGSFRVAVWYDANGDGVIDAGDQIGVAPASCTSSAACQIGSIGMSIVPTGYVLP